MARPLFSLKEMKGLRESLAGVDTDPALLGWDSRAQAKQIILGAHYAQAVERIQAGRMQDLLNYLIRIVGSKGSRADIRVWEGFSLADDAEYCEILRCYNTSQIRRDLHTWLSAVLTARRDWGTTAFVKFLRGNKTGKGYGFSSFNKDAGWIEHQVNAVATILFDSDSEVSKLFMQYDTGLQDRVHDAIKQGADIAYGTQFAATYRMVNEQFIQQLIELLEQGDMAPLEIVAKKPPKQRIPYAFKEGDIIKPDTIRDLPSMAVVEIAVLARAKGGANTPTTVQIVVLETPQPRESLNIWRIVGVEARLPPEYDGSFDHDRASLVGATYVGLWPEGKGVQAQKPRYRYPYEFIELRSK